MSIEVLLHKHNARLAGLSLSRVRLNQSTPFVSWAEPNGEVVLYSLTGKVSVYVEEQYMGTLGGRGQIQDEAAQAMRLRGCGGYALTLSHQSYAADLLMIVCEHDRQQPLPIVTPHLTDAMWHTVGDGCHLRRVAEIPTPPGAMIFCGETHNIVGGISSWPPHATERDVERFTNGETTWQEVMWFACNTPGIANMKGVYTGGVVVNKLMEIANGAAHVMPLGSHAIHAGPNGSMYYVWAYVGTALQKQYNQAADDLSTYRK